MKPDERSGGIWAWAFGLIPVVWLALLVADSGDYRVFPRGDERPVSY